MKKAITEWRSRLEIKARRIQEKPLSGEFCGGTITVVFADVNNPLGLSLFRKVMMREFIGLGLVSWPY